MFAHWLIFLKKSGSVASKINSEAGKWPCLMENHLEMRQSVPSAHLPRLKGRSRCDRIHLAKEGYLPNRLGGRRFEFPA